ncbi:MAG: hypothetical protein EZS28_002798 [Streblomastix strix]|uniref:Uncharacterized protein n=1 Tax=Streblomastix strix TaxID=222440 RepID=A0A5J4X385_9EUKA|nr:MAG: hypothetical protein EZS28_002798 [Streblomastix strix]
MALSIPLVVWEQNPPHAIVALGASINGEDIISGDENGKMVLWNFCFNSEQRHLLEPKSIMVSSSGSSVISLTVFIVQGLRIVACIQDNSDLRVWDLETGNLLSNFRFTYGKPLQIIHIYSNLVAIRGCFNGVYIIDSFSGLIYDRLAEEEGEIRGIYCLTSNNQNNESTIVNH